MNTIKDLEKLANDLLKKEFTFKHLQTRENITISGTSIGYIFTFDNARSRLGCCDYGKKIISLSKPIASVNLDKINSKLTDTILHELAHAFSYHLYGRNLGLGHGVYWQRTALAIGSNGKRCYSTKEVTPTKSKYTLTCGTCKKESPMHRKPKRTYSCSKCSPNKYNANFKLELTQNY